jgi:hypothetical protein
MRARGSTGIKPWLRGARYPAAPPCSRAARAHAQKGQESSKRMAMSDGSAPLHGPGRRASASKCAVLVPMGPGCAQQSIVACSARTRARTRARARVRSIALRRHFSAGGRPICGAIVRRVRVRRVQHQRLPAGRDEDRLRGAVRQCGRRTRQVVQWQCEHRRLPERLLHRQRRRLL